MDAPTSSPEEVPPDLRTSLVPRNCMRPWPWQLSCTSCSLQVYPLASIVNFQRFKQAFTLSNVPLFPRLLRRLPSSSRFSFFPLLLPSPSPQHPSTFQVPRKSSSSPQGALDSTIFVLSITDVLSVLSPLHTALKHCRYEPSLCGRTGCFHMNMSKIRRNQSNGDYVFAAKKNGRCAKCKRPSTSRLQNTSTWGTIRIQVLLKHTLQI